jgi:hypothetical protein
MVARVEDLQQGEGEDAVRDLEEGLRRKTFGRAMSSSALRVAASNSRSHSDFLVSV